MAQHFLKHEISESSPIHSKLKDLKLFNLFCGDHDLTCDKDWKHVMKQLRNVLLRENGVVVSGIHINSYVILCHLVDSGVDPQSAQT